MANNGGSISPEEEIRQLRQALQTQKEQARIEKQRADKAEAITRPMEFYECLAFCHKFSMNKRMLTIPCTTYSATKPEGRLRPECLNQWLEFPAMKLEMLKKVGDAIPRGTRVFLSQSDIEAVTIHLENPLTTIAEQLQSIPEARRVLADTSSPFFRSSTNNEFIDLFEEERFAQETSSMLDISRLQPSRVCLAKTNTGANAEVERLAYIVKCKSPAIFTMDRIRAAMRPMDLAREVINKNDTPTDDTELFVHQSTHHVAAAVVETYNCMICGGLEYGLLTTGEAYIFLKIDWANPKVVYYHVADPESEVRENGDGTFLSAIAQVLAFSLIALNAPIHDLDTRNRVMDALPTWGANSDATDSLNNEKSRGSMHSRPRGPNDKHNSLQLIGRDSDIASSTTGPNAGTTSTIPYTTTNSDCSSQSSSTWRGDSPPPNKHGSSDGDCTHESTPVPGAWQMAHSDVTSATGGTAQNESNSQSQGQDGQVRLNKAAIPLYCTSKCLSGLVNGAEMDPHCPNYHHHLHWRHPGDIGPTGNEGIKSQDRHGGEKKLERLHPVDHTTWLSLLHTQLSHTVVQGVTPLGIVGSSGALFRLTLIEYGYTFVAKGTVEWMIYKLRREEDAYRVLKPIQGQLIPVYLGSVDLRCLHTRVFIDFGIDLVYLVLLSYGGRELRSLLKERTQEQGQELDKETRLSIGQQVVDAVLALHVLEVVHTDVRSANFLVDDLNNVMVIDFERALILPYSLEACRRQLREAQESQEMQDSEVRSRKKPKAKQNQNRTQRPKRKGHTRQYRFLSRCVGTSEQDIGLAKGLQREIEGE
ncbi:Protein kinase-like domain protein [Ceratocystis lukuohia]|uniref:EKC/KEOPS complex subunit BUD32 n=1 Tax=Ceratocystis lukuohia TaxID=2019550 RepID=A0ABR4MLE7_9PEZI